MARRKQWESGMCPLCENVIETVNHVFQCKTKESTDLFYTNLTELKKKLISMDTETQLSKDIILMIETLSSKYKFRPQSLI